MIWVAWKMLTGDRAKNYGLIAAISFSTMLMSRQMSIFCGLMLRTTSQIQDTTAADTWVMDAGQQNSDEIQSLPEGALYRVRSVPGVSWAVRLYKGLMRVRIESGAFRTAIVMGLDDDSLAGAPREILAGSLADLRRPDAVMIDSAGFAALSTSEFAWRTIWYFIGSTGIPVNFGITVMLGFIVGTAVSGQTFYLFRLEDLKQFGSLKAMGVGNITLLGMLLFQASAVVSGRGDSTVHYPLQFVRVEPVIIPKRSLTGDATERTDTSVLQVVYALPGGGDKFHSGQQFDVSIELKSKAAIQTEPAIADR